MGAHCGHAGGATRFQVGEDSLTLCSRCHAVVTQPWHDKLRETSDALIEAQREIEALRADLVWGVHSRVHHTFAAGNSFLEWRTDFGQCVERHDGTDTDLLRAIREARRG